MHDPAQVAFQPAMRARSLRGKRLHAVRLGETPYVLFRDGDGQPRCLRDRCAHRFAPLSEGRVTDDGQVRCGYHGWTFNGEGRGTALGQPRIKRCNVESLRVREHGGWLWVGGANARDELPALGKDGFHFVGSFESKANAPFHIVLDNFSEDEHTPFVHGRLGWTPERASEVEFSSKNHDEHVEVAYTAPQRQTALLPLVGVRDGDLFHNQWVTRFFPIHLTYTISWSDPKTDRKRPVQLRYTMVFVPSGNDATRIVVFTEARIASRAAFVLEPVVGRIGMALAWKEVLDDVRWVRKILDTPKSFEGMRLGRYDAPLVYQRRTIERLYSDGADLVPLESVRARS